MSGAGLLCQMEQRHMPVPRSAYMQSPGVLQPLIGKLLHVIRALSGQLETKHCAATCCRTGIGMVLKDGVQDNKPSLMLTTRRWPNRGPRTESTALRDIRMKSTSTVSRSE